MDPLHGRRFAKPSEWRAPAQYALALAVVAISLAVRAALGGVLEDRVPFFLTLGALLPLVLLVRPGPFIAAAVLGGAGSVYLFVPPAFSFTLEGSPEEVMLVYFAAALALAIATAWLSHRYNERSAQDQRALQTSLERQNSLLKVMDQAFCVCEVRFDEHDTPRDYCWLETNPAFSTHTGLVEVIGKSTRELVPELEPFWLELYGAVALTGQPGRIEKYSEAFGKWFQIEAFRVGEAHERKVASLFSDITARKRSEHARQEEGRRLRLVMDAVPALISYVDRDLRYQLVNKGYEDWFGLPQASVQGQHVRDVLGVDAFETIRPHVEAALAGELVEYEASVPFREGGRRFIHAYYVPEIEQDGSVPGFFALVHDVTAAKNIELALHESSRHKDEFLATLAHELRNPLGAIRMALGALRRAGRESGRREEMIAIIDRQSSLLVRLVHDLLDVNRISRGKIELRLERLDLGALVEGLVADVRPACCNNGLSIALELPTGPLEIDADPQRLSQAINNLLHNACKFTGPGGEIRVSVAREGDEAVIRVTDTGIGMSAELLPTVFDMFSQAEDSHDRQRAGLGIGLSLARSIIELMGGSIAAHSAGPGHGSEFAIRLPALAAGVHDSVEATIDTSRPRNARRRILAADDNADALQAVSMVLRLSGHKVEVAVDGAQALQKITAHRPDIALIDIGMPSLDGYEVARQVRRQPWGREILLVAMTGWGQPEDKALAKAAGFDAHITKPVDPEELEQVLTQSCYSAAAAAAADRH